MIQNIPENNRPTVKGHVVSRPNLKYATSKWCVSIIDLYEILFDPLKHKQIRMLQLGIYHGECMRYFRDFFTHPDTVLVGLDRSLEHCSGVNLPNVFLKKGDQENVSLITQIADEYGPFDIIIDDASHAAGPTETSFKCLWEHLKNGGLYCIEDACNVPMKALVRKLLKEVVENHEGKGYCSNQHIGFGLHASSSPLCIIKKTTDLITGLEI
jgi:hypothetical protein